MQHILANLAKEAHKMTKNIISLLPTVADCGQLPRSLKCVRTNHGKHCPSSSWILRKCDADNCCREPPASLLHLWSCLEDYLPMVLSLAVGYLAVAVKHCFAHNNKPHLDFVPYYCCMVVVAQNYQIWLVHDLQNHSDDQNFDYTYCYHDSTTSPGLLVE
uniref:Uncharacterized protein n=1 Tax=Romanomermis culicivorax TaxID=13658 RepID=A0A915J2K4_ROMCU